VGTRVENPAVKKKKTTGERCALANELRWRRNPSATFLSNILVLHAGLKVEFVRWVCELILVRNISIVMDSYSIYR